MSAAKRSPPLPVEPRQDLPIPLPVSLRRPGGALQTVYAVNVSEGGLCLHLREPLRAGDEVDVDFILPPDGPRVAARARVVWCGDAAGGAGGSHAETGLRFDKLDDALREALRTYASRPANRRR